MRKLSFSLCAFIALSLNVYADDTDLKSSFTSNIYPYFASTNWTNGQDFCLKKETYDKYIEKVNSYNSGSATITQEEYNELLGVVTNINNFNLPADNAWKIFYIVNGQHAYWKVAMGIEGTNGRGTSLDQYTVGRGVGDAAPGKYIRLEKTADNAYKLYCNGYYFGDSQNGTNIPLVTDQSKAVSYSFTMVKPGIVALRPYGSTDDNTYINDNTINDAGYLQGGTKDTDVSWWRPQPASVESFTIPLTEINGNSYATTCLPFPAKITSANTDYSVKVYYGTREDKANERLYLREITGVVPAETPVLLISNQTGSPKATVSVVADETPSAVNDNKLDGTIRPLQISTTDLSFGWVTTNGTKVPGFYPTPMYNCLHANKAYIKNPAGAKSVTLAIDDEPSGLQPPTATANKTTATYNILGQRVGADYKGIVIVNGKKILNH